MDGIHDYQQFTKPAELHKAINTLRGLVDGMTAEDGLSEPEAMELANWCSLHVGLQNRHPFSELIPMIRSALEDCVLDNDERQDILWLCSNFDNDSKYYDVITSSIQYLSGLIHGIMADGALSDKEVDKLLGWIEQNGYLQGTYPFDEIDSLLHTAIADGHLSDDERNMLMAFFGTVIDFKDSWNLSETDFAALRKEYSIDGICAFCPNISFDNKVFCFTGQSSVCERSTIIDEIVGLGGIFRTSVSKKTDYLIVGDSGNPCWAYACYGRKVEDAISLRKAGASVQIINERDFWDAVHDIKANMNKNDPDLPADVGESMGQAKP